MYPLAENRFAPLNSWYVAAWSDEITAAPRERWLLEQPIVFYRRSNGTVTALDGRCPHRHFPLAKGRVIDDNLQCGYHGLTVSTAFSSVIRILRAGHAAIWNDLSRSGSPRRV